MNIIPHNYFKHRKVVALSGGFDMLHVGHLRMIKEARKLGDWLIVFVNNDNWLKKKKGYSLMCQEDRFEIVSSIVGVDAVYLTEHDEECADMSVCAELRKYRPDIFANGGDRFDDNIPELAACRELGIELAFNVGGGKVRSSSSLVREAACQTMK